MRKKTLAAGISLLFPDSGDIAWNRLGGCRTAGRFCEKKPASGNWRGVWNRLDGAGYAETDGCGAFFKHPAGASTAAISAVVALALALLASLGGD